jgi:hypothetical protein
VSGDEPIFSRRTLILWSAAAIAAFVVALYFMGKGDGNAADLTGPTVASRSALGYAGIADILRQLDMEVVSSRNRARSIERAQDSGVLIVAEPRLSPQTMAVGRKLLDADSVLLILPKWDGVASKSHSGWVEQAELTSILPALLAMNLVDAGARVVRGPAPADWDHNTIGIAPVVSAPVQFIRSDVLTPLVAHGDQILVGEVRRKGKRIFVLSDPDVLSNLGLAHPVNADFAVALIGKLRQGDGPVVFDESLGLATGSGPNIFRLLFRFPLLTGAVLGLIAVVLLLWSAMPRFGAPDPVAPALESGKRGLIDNIASLVGFAGHRPAIVGRFVDATIQDVARQLQAPRGLAGKALTEWLIRVGNARGVTVNPAGALEQADRIAGQRRADPATLVALARDINRWKREIINGPGRHQTSR